MEALGIRQEYAFIRKKLQEEESLDKILRDRHRRELSQEDLEAEYERIYNQFFIPYGKFIDFWYLTADGWGLAIDLMTKLNISAPDAIHLATAVEAKCNVFISSDEILVKRSNKFIQSFTPDNFFRMPQNQKSKK